MASKAETVEEVRQFVVDCLARGNDAEAIARTKTGALRLFADGVNDGMYEALKHVLLFIDGAR